MTPDQFRLKCYIAGYFISDEELDEAFAALDKMGSGEVVFADYLRWRQRDDRFAGFQQQSNAYVNYCRQVADVFRYYDSSLKGYLDMEQFAQLYEYLKLAGEVTAPLETVLDELDSDGEGTIQLNGFVAWYTQASTTADDV